MEPVGAHEKRNKRLQIKCRFVLPTPIDISVIRESGFIPVELVPAGSSLSNLLSTVSVDSIATSSGKSYP